MPLDLLTFPPELVLEIADHLPPDGIVALRLTHPYLNRVLDRRALKKPQNLSRCQKYAVQSYLTDPKSSHIRCRMCNSRYPVSLFHSSNSPQCQPKNALPPEPDTEVVEMPERFCAWHVGRLARIQETEKGGRSGWVSRIEEMCLCCGTVVTWRDCGCKCDSCGTTRVRTYTRYVTPDECSSKGFRFFRNKDEVFEDEEEKRKNGAGKDVLRAKYGKLYVEEELWLPGKKRMVDSLDGPTTISLPVQFEDGYTPCSSETALTPITEDCVPTSG